MNLVQATLKSDNTVYAQLDLDVGPDEVKQTARDMGITSPARRLPGRGARRPDGRRLAARDGARLRDDRLRRLPQPADRDHARSTFPDGHVEQPRRPRRKRKVFTDGVTYEATQDPRGERPGGHRHARADRLPGGRQDRHDRQLHRRLVRRLHAAPATAVWVGYPNATRSVPAIQGRRHLPAAHDLGHDYMKSRDGGFCGELPAAQGAVRGRAVLRPVRAHGRATRTATRRPAARTGATSPAREAVTRTARARGQRRRTEVPARPVRVAAARRRRAPRAPAATAGRPARRPGAQRRGRSAPRPDSGRSGWYRPRMAKEERSSSKARSSRRSRTRCSA